MTMDLYFLRHGDAEPGDPERPDSERRLTAKGKATTRAEAEGMKRLGMELDLILTSPYVRARQTAEIAADALGAGAPQAADELACGCRVGDLQRALAPHMGLSAVMVVGHEPDFSTMIGALIGDALVDVKKGGLALVSLDFVEAGTGVLRWLLAPKHLVAE